MQRARIEPGVYVFAHPLHGAMLARGKPRAKTIPL
jgi:hypothetical protein